MIVIVCTDDQQLVQVATAANQSNPNVFGTVHAVYNHQIPTLGVNENLFIIAHGASVGQHGEPPEIGDQRHAFGVTGSDLWANIKPIFPPNYAGAVYVDACYSADTDQGVASFISSFQATLRQYGTGMKNVVVWGRNGLSSGAIEVPGPHSHWVQAH
jgi:hypothetical protein